MYEANKKTEANKALVTEGERAYPSMQDNSEQEGIQPQEGKRC